MQKDPSKTLGLTSNLKALALAAASLERLHDLKSRALGLDKNLPIHEEMPVLIFRDLSHEEIEVLHQKDDQDGDEDEDEAVPFVDLLEGIGRQDDNGRWRYTRADVCYLAIASHLARSLTIEHAMTIAGTARNAVIGWLAEEPTEFHLQVRARYRFVIGYEALGKFRSAPLDDPHRSRFEIDMCHLVNPRLIAESLPKLRQWYNAEREAATRD